MKSKLKCSHPHCNKSIRGGSYWCRTHRQFSIAAKYYSLLHVAAKKNLKVSISKAQLEGLLEDALCSYCSMPLLSTGYGLDRLDNKKGYSINNVITCCTDCNSLKSNLLTTEETKKVVALLKKLRHSEILWAKPTNRRKKNGISRSRRK